MAPKTKTTDKGVTVSRGGGTRTRTRTTKSGATKTITRTKGGGRSVSVSKTNKAGKTVSRNRAADGSKSRSKTTVRESGKSVTRTKAGGRGERSKAGFTTTQDKGKRTVTKTKNAGGKTTQVRKVNNETGATGGRKGKGVKYSTKNGKAVMNRKVAAKKKLRKGEVTNRLRARKLAGKKTKTRGA